MGACMNDDEIYNLYCHEYSIGDPEKLYIKKGLMESSGFVFFRIRCAAYELKREILKSIPFLKLFL